MRKTLLLRRTPLHVWRVGVLALAVTAALGASVTARADLFGDDQARQAILDLRRRVDQVVLSQNKLIDDNAQLRRSLLELQQQIDSLKDDLARARGQNEQLAQQLADLQKQQIALQQQIAAAQTQLGANQNGAPAGPGSGDDAALNSQQTQAQVTPPDGNPGGAVIPASNPQEKQSFDAALAQFRGGNFVAAQVSFANFIKRYPRSPRAPTALFWLGNAQYATRNYKEAISNFRSLLAAVPQNDKAPEALLSIANCQLELKDQKAARAALEQLVKTYPQSEAASAARDRLAKMK